MNSVEVLYPPLSRRFYNNLFLTESDLLLVAPYVKYGVARKIIDVLQASGKKPTVKLTLITNVNSTNFANGSSDAKAIETILKEIPGARIIGMGNLHAKCYIFDAKTAIISSGNLTPSGMDSNLEMAVQLNEIEIVHKLHQAFLTKYAASGKKISVHDIAKIGHSIEDYFIENAASIDLHNKEVLKLNISFDKFVSPRVMLENTEVVAPEITSIISSRGPLKFAGVNERLGVRERLPIQKIHHKVNKAHVDIELKWLRMYQALCDFRETNSKYWPMKNEVFNGHRVGNWAYNQRVSFAKKNLAKAKIDLLNKIGFEFDREKNIWEFAYSLLCDYRDEYPNQWPNTREMYHDIPLGAWCLAQSKLYHKNELSKARIAKLNKLGFVWDSLEFYWAKSIQLLKDFRKSRPDQWPVSGELFRGYDLFHWCIELVIRRKGRLTKKQLSDLKELKFPLGTFRSEHRLIKWNLVFALLQKYVLENKHLPNHDAVYNSQPLGRWLIKQKDRMYAPNSKMPTYQRRKLEALGVRPISPNEHAKLLKTTKQN